LEVFVKNEKKTAFVILAVLIFGLVFSCTTTGNYMPLSQGEVVIGTVQATFTVRTSFFSRKSKDIVNAQAYIHLMEAAGQRYSGSIDIRDIVWVTGKSVDNVNTEISATGKVVQTN
jgi:hypothetical protein